MTTHEIKTHEVVIAKKFCALIIFMAGLPHKMF